jgi:hypothetical protein
MGNGKSTRFVEKEKPLKLQAKSHLDSGKFVK